jgi:hypothetical protein
MDVLCEGTDIAFVEIGTILLGYCYGSLQLDVPKPDHPILMSSNKQIGSF